MKKNIISLSLLLLLSCFAGRARSVNDTTLVRSSNIEFSVETETNKAGESKTAYYCTIDGKTYASNKTSANRYALIRRFGGNACVVIITTATGRQRIAVL